MTEFPTTLALSAVRQGRPPRQGGVGPAGCRSGLRPRAQHGLGLALGSPRSTRSSIYRRRRGRSCIRQGEDGAGRGDAAQHVLAEMQRGAEGQRRQPLRLPGRIEMGHTGARAAPPRTPRPARRPAPGRHCAGRDRLRAARSAPPARRERPTSGENLTLDPRLRERLSTETGRWCHGEETASSTLRGSSTWIGLTDGS